MAASSDPKPLASLALTHVHYDPTDPISHLCAWAALLPQFLCIVYTTLLYTTREVEIALVFAGQLACEGLNWGLKRWIKEERPERVRYLGKGYGMPSSHAQFVGFWAVYVVLFLMLRHSPCLPGGYAVSRASQPGSTSGAGQTKDHKQGSGQRQGQMAMVSTALPDGVSPVYRLQLHHPKLTHALLSVVFVVTAIGVCMSRVYLGYHTTRQVWVGVSVGAGFAVLWFGFTEFIRRVGLVEWVLEWEIVRRARVRDLCCEEDLVELGWQMWEEKRRRRGLGENSIASKSRKAQ